MIVTADDVLDDDVLLPGDVVTDAATHRPMQVVGYDHRTAEQVEEVWESDVNQQWLDLDPDGDVVELVSIPRGDRYFVPTDVERFPVERLQRVLTEPATGECRTQRKVVRAVLAHLVSDARSLDHEGLDEVLLALFRRHWSDEFVDEIEEFAGTVPETK